MLLEFKTCTGQAAFCHTGFSHKQTNHLTVYWSAHFDRRGKKNPQNKARLENPSLNWIFGLWKMALWCRCCYWINPTLMWGLIQAAIWSHTLWPGYSMVKQATAQLRISKKLSEQCSPGTVRGIRLKQYTHTDSYTYCWHPVKPISGFQSFLAIFAEQNNIAAVPQTMGSLVICTENKENWHVIMHLV